MTSLRPPRHIQSGPALFTTYGLKIPSRKEKNVPTITPKATPHPPSMAPSCSRGLYSRIAISSLSRKPDRRHPRNAENDHRRQPAETRLAGGNEEVVAGLARLGNRARAREARRDAAVAEGAGRRRHR